MGADESFADLVDALADRHGVTVPGETAVRGFGSDALKVDGAIFAMPVPGALVVKLPASRVAELIEAGVGAAFDAGKGTPMKEWLTVVEHEPAAWLALAEEALEFVRSRTARKQRH